MKNTITNRKKKRIFFIEKRISVSGIDVSERSGAIEGKQKELLFL